MLPGLERIETELTAAGWPALSPWWLATLRRVALARGDGLRTCVVRAGRRGGKSTTMCRVVVGEALFGEWVVPPGDVAVVGIVSLDRREAAGRLRTIEEILKVLGFRKVRELSENVEARAKQYCKRGSELEIEVRGTPVLFRVHTATIAGVVGFTAIAVLCDEVARWLDKDAGTNPAEEVLASLKPCMATVPTALMWLISSPWSTLDAHHDAFERGNKRTQVVASAPTWVCNPTLTEQACVDLEPDEETRAREYGAIPMSSDASNIFDASEIDAAVNAFELHAGWVAFAADFAFTRNTSALIGCRTDGERFATCVVRERRPKPGHPLKPREVIADFAGDIRAHGAENCMADAHYSETVTEEFEPVDLERVPAPTMQARIAATYVRFRVLLKAGRISLTKHRKLIRQLKAVKQKPTVNGGISIEHPKVGSEHGDVAAACVLAIWHADHSEPSDREMPRYPSRSQGFDPRLIESEPGELRDYPDHSGDLL
jgi:hypothetical protein